MDNGKRNKILFLINIIIIILVVTILCFGGLNSHKYDDSAPVLNWKTYSNDTAEFELNGLKFGVPEDDYITGGVFYENSTKKVLMTKSIEVIVYADNSTETGSEVMSNNKINPITFEFSNLTINGKKGYLHTHISDFSSEPKFYYFYEDNGKLVEINGGELIQNPETTLSEIIK